MSRLLYTHHVWVYIMKSKSEAFRLFIDWKAIVKMGVEGRSTP